MQFQVPQYIEVEDKIFGPLTFKQFIYIAGGGGLSFILWRALPIFVAGPLIVGALALAASLAFMQLNNRPFVLALEHGFFYLVRNKLYIWNAERKENKKKKEVEKAIAKTAVHIPKLSDSKLHELSWSLDIKERLEHDNMRDVPDEAQNKVASIRATDNVRT